jgi:hypothetical protein
MTHEQGVKAAVAAGASSLTFWGITLAEFNQVLQAVVGVLTAISIIVLILVNLKKLRKP